MANGTIQLRMLSVGNCGSFVSDDERTGERDHEEHRHGHQRDDRGGYAQDVHEAAPGQGHGDGQPGRGPAMASATAAVATAVTTRSCSRDRRAALAP